VALTGGSVVFGLSSSAMATVGLLATRRLIPRAKRAGNFSRSSPKRKLNIAFAAISVGGYSVQLGLAVALLWNTQSGALQRAFGSRHCGSLWQRPWPDMGGHRDNPAGISRLEGRRRVVLPRRLAAASGRVWREILE
jgi:hypothetical protein